MTCTKEEIERKRLAALQKKQANISNQNTSCVSSGTSVATSTCVLRSPSAGYIKAKTNNEKFHPYSKTSKIFQSDNTCTVPITKVVSGTVYLISEDRFEVNPSEFCAPLINVFKSISSKIYDSKTNLWNFSIDHYHELIEKTAPLAPHIVLGPLPQYVLKVLREEVVDPIQIDLSPIEATLRQKLLSFQEEGVRFGIAHRGRCMIADEMGLGKTFQALAIASYYRHNWPLLIVTTSSMRETWRSKINELLPSVPLMNIVTLSTRKDALLVADRQTEVVIASYKIITIHIELIKSKKFGVIIVDESHYLKSRKAQCTAALGAAARAASRLLLLSGTPALSRPAELYTQLQLIQPGLFGSFIEYGKRYCAGKQTSFGWDMSGQSHLAELGVLLQRRFLIRRTKEQVLTLAEKTREAVMLDESLLDFSSKEGRGLSQLADQYRSTPPAQRHAALITLFSESAHIKIPAICKYIRQLLSETTDKFLVFAHHRSVLDAICNALDEARTSYISIHGATPAALRADLVQRFQTSAGCRGAVLSVTAAGAGLSLSAAALVVFAELHWTPGVLAQAEARAHRLGRAGAVRVRYLLARGTADDLVWPLLRDKLNVLNDVGLSHDSFEDTACKHQESNNKITKYLSPMRGTKNKNDYIPGTNIRKYTENTKTTSLNTSALGETSMNTDTTDKELEDIEDYFLNDDEMLQNGDCLESFHYEDDVDKSFLVDAEGDELLANIDL